MERHAEYLQAAKESERSLEEVWAHQQRINQRVKWRAESFC